MGQRIFWKGYVFRGWVEFSKIFGWLFVKKGVLLVLDFGFVWIVEKFRLDRW